MSTKNRSIYLTDEAVEALRLPSQRENPRDYSLSSRLNSVVGRYDKMIAELIPALSRAEWVAIFECLRRFGGGQTGGAVGNGELIWATVADAPARYTAVFVDQMRKAGVDFADLAKRLRALSAAQTIAVAEVVDRYFSKGAPNLGNSRADGIFMQSIGAGGKEK